jgi:hypothetical protein
VQCSAGQCRILMGVTHVTYDIDSGRARNPVLTIHLLSLEIYRISPLCSPRWATRPGERERERERGGGRDERERECVTSKEREER